MKLILLEPRLKSTTRYHIRYAMALCAAAKRLGIDTRVVTNRNITREAFSTLVHARAEVAPDFRTDLCLGLRARMLTWPILAAEYGRVLFRELRLSGPDDLLCTFSGQLELISGSLPILAMTKPGNQLIMQMYHWKRREQDSITPRILRAYRRTVERLLDREIDGRRLVIAGQTETISSSLRQILDRPVLTLPMIVDWDSYPAPKKQTGRPVIGFIGPTRTIKGFDQFVGAVAGMKAPARFQVHASMPKAASETYPPHKMSRMLAVLRELPNCTVHTRDFTLEEYNTFVQGLDIVVLPYRPKDFSHCR